MSQLESLPFQDVIDALLDLETPFPPRFLYRFSDLDKADLLSLTAIWSQVADWRRRALMEDIEVLGEKDSLLSFTELGCFAASDLDARVRLLAVRLLWDYEENELIPLFLRLLKQDKDVEVRTTAAGALGHFVYAGEVGDLPARTYHEIEDALLEVLSSGAPAPVRLSALESLGFSGNEKISAHIEHAFASNDTQWIASALFAVGRSADSRWNANVLSMLGNKKPQLRSEAARAAGELEIPEAVTQLLELLDDPNDEIRQNSIWSLSQIGGEGVHEKLESMLEEAEDDEEIDLISEALENLAFTEGSQDMSLVDYPEEDDDMDEDLDLFDEDEDNED